MGKYLGHIATFKGDIKQQNCHNMSDIWQQFRTPHWDNVFHNCTCILCISYVINDVKINDTYTS